MTTLHRRRRGHSALVALLAALALLLTACSGSSDSADKSVEPAESSAAAKVTGEIAVLTAASLKESFEQIKTDLAKKYPDLTVNLQYGGSGQLAAQIQQGAPVDVFASADDASMKTLTDAKLIAKSVNIATNKLEIVVPKGNPGKVTSLKDLTNPDLTIVTCAEAAACGKTQLKIEQKTGLKIATDSQEPDVKSVLQKVAMGEADAGLVYVTDVKSQGEKVEGIEFPEAAEFANNYPMGVVEASANKEAAQAFVDYVSGPDGEKVLQGKGFGKP